MVLFCGGITHHGQAAGENPAWLSKQMGHKDWGMIRRIHAQWIPSDDDGAG
jgi:integrase